MNTWTMPRIVVDKFRPNEYCAICKDDNGNNVLFSMNAMASFPYWDYNKNQRYDSGEQYTALERGKAGFAFTLANGQYYHYFYKEQSYQSGASHRSQWYVYVYAPGEAYLYADNPTKWEGQISASKAFNS